MSNKFKSTCIVSACLVACSLPFLNSCKERNSGIKTVNIEDSTMMDTQNFEIHKIHVGNHITNVPMCSQIVNIDGTEKYLMLDETNIYVFDWKSGELTDSIPVSKCGNLANLSGFSYVSKNKIAVFNDSSKKVYIIDMKGNILSQTDVPYDEENPAKYAATEATNSTRLILQGDNVLLSGRILGCLQLAKSMGFSKIPVSENLNIKNGKTHIVATYPDAYLNSNWGTLYMNSVYTTYDNNGNTLYSYPILNKILKYNQDFSKCDTVIMQSRYDNGIKPCQIEQEKIEENESLETKYYISQLSYSNLLFDPYRNLYIRTVEHPLKKWNVKERFIKPKSFVISNTKGEVLSETPVVKNSKEMINSNMHICKEGLAIAMLNKDENNIYFACFKIK